MKKINDLQDVIYSGLCNRCGTCVGLSFGKIVFDKKEGRYLPNILEAPDSDTLRKILSACSGKGFNFPENQKRIFGEDAFFHLYTGSYRSLHIGFSTNPKIRELGASGGIISAILSYLLQIGEIDGAVVTKMCPQKPWLTRSFIATTTEDIYLAAQSKYILTSVNEILPEIGAFNGKLAYVGLPGQVQSIRALQKMDHPWTKNIKYIFGPFYGNTLHFSSIISFLRSYGEKDYKNIVRLYFRYGEWPGNMRVELKSGRVLQLKKFHANYLIPFHIVKNSLICTDLTNEFTDISGGDAWAQIYEERGKGFSMVISRSKKGEEVLKRMKEEGYLNLTPIGIEESVKMHSHGYDLKKRGAFIRMRYMKILGMTVPDYGYNIRGFSIIRHLMEVITDILFLIAGSRVARFFVERIPPEVIGVVFEKARNFWKKLTHNIKRDDL